MVVDKSASRGNDIDESETERHLECTQQRKREKEREREREDAFSLRVCFGGMSQA